MMKRYLRTLLCLCLLLSFGAKAEGFFTDVFVFGDSLSDTGNLAGFIDVNLPFPGPQPIGTVGLCNPVDIFILGKSCEDLFFLKRRVSNAPVAVETLANRLGFDSLEPSLYLLPLILRPAKCSVDLVTPCTGTNYAVAGAHAIPPDPTDLGDVLPALPTQIEAFLVDHVFSAPPFSAPPDALYVVMIGGNDVIEAVKSAGDLIKGVALEPDEKPEAIIDAAVDAIGDNISLLIKQGAQKILVANSANIGSVPATRMRADEEGLPRALVIGIATQLTKQFNKKLARRLDQIRAEQNVNSVKIKEFNLFRFFEGVRFVGRIFRLNVVDACFNTDKYRASDIAEREFHPDCAPEEPGDKPKFDDFIFFDDLHPTGQVHAAIGRAMARTALRLINHRNHKKWIRH